MYITSENGIEKYASDQMLWPKQNRVSNFGHFLCIFGSFEAKNGHSSGNSSRPPRELKFFLVSHMTYSNGKML